MPMHRDRDDPFKDPDIHLKPLPAGDPSEPDGQPEPWADPVQYPRLRPAPARRQRLDWGGVAVLLARGQSVPAVAETFRCEPGRIWRNLKRSKRFRARIELELDRLKLQTSIQFRNLASQTVREIGRRADKLDTKTLLWMAEKLRLGARPRRADALGDWLDSVAALQIRAAPSPEAEPEGPRQIGSAADFLADLQLAEQAGDDRMVEHLVQVEKSRLGVNVQLQKLFQAEDAAAEQRVDI